MAHIFYARWKHGISPIMIDGGQDIPSPLSGQQEVTAFGKNSVGDANDNWRVEVEGRGIWFSKKKIRLIHLDTGLALHSHENHSKSEYTAFQQEVTCFDGRDDNDFWKIYQAN